MHLTAIFNDDELAEQATTKDFLAVRQAESALEQMSLGRVPAMKSFLGCRTGLSALSPSIRGRLDTYLRQVIKHRRESKGNEGVLKGCFERGGLFYFYRSVRCLVLLLSAVWNPYAKHVARCLMGWRRVPGAVQIVVKQCEAWSVGAYFWGLRP